MVQVHAHTLASLHPILNRIAITTDTPPVGDDDTPTPAADLPAAGTSTGKYVPPSMRAGAGATRGAGESMFRSR